MFKYLKSIFLIICYGIVYLLVMLLCQVILGLAIGGAGAPLMDAINRGAADNPAALQDAADAAMNIINEYVGRNSGFILSISALISLLIFIYIFKIRQRDLFTSVRMKHAPSGADIRYALFAGASANFVVSLVIAGIQGLGLFKDMFERYEAHFNTTLGDGGTFQILLGMGIIVPIVEEILFRGMIMLEAERVTPVKAAIVIQGVLFGLYHLVPIQILYAIPLGIYFGYMVYKSGTLWTAVAAHMAMNCAAVALTVPRVENALIGRPETGLFVTLISLILFVVSFAYFIRKKPAQPDL